MNNENKNIRRVGILGAATLATLAGGAMALSSIQEFRRLEVMRGAVSASTNSVSPEAPQARQINKGMEDALAYSGIGGVVFIAGSVISGGAGISIIQSGRRRPERA